ncbi:hypothetical protein RV134_350069 [Roseovarius sp. EC-HK134]|nr:hypothetical protein RV420_400346 [Roseovarius sp. EC-SD190]VVT28029.1 hypothetical protein RV134_350069 [Roseovarius sp. EC-HK134]
MVAHLFWEQGVVGSNPIAPTILPTSAQLRPSGVCAFGCARAAFFDKRPARQTSTSFAAMPGKCAGNNGFFAGPPVDESCPRPGGRDLRHSQTIFLPKSEKFSLTAYGNIRQFVWTGSKATTYSGSPRQGHDTNTQDDEIATTPHGMARGRFRAPNRHRSRLKRPTHIRRDA